MIKGFEAGERRAVLVGLSGSSSTGERRRRRRNRPGGARCRAKAIVALNITF